MRVARLLIPLLSALLLSACSDTLTEVVSTPLVVDGWIDAGGAPVVMVSRTVSPTDNIQDETVLLTKVVSYAKVRVSDGERTVELTGRKDENYFPPYIYTTDQLVGEPGKTYRLEVDYPGIQAWAETTIPEPVALDHFEVKASHRTDTLYTLTAVFRDPPEQRNYYKFFTKVEGSNTSWNSSFLGLLDDAMLASPEVSMPVSRGWGMLEKYRQPLFRLSETVQVKFCTIDATSYQYWKTYDDMTALARNPFFPVTENVFTNMHGAQGFWAGYGASFYTVTIVKP